MSKPRPTILEQQVITMRRVRDRMRNGVDGFHGHIPADTYRRDIAEWAKQQRARDAALTDDSTPRDEDGDDE